MQIRDQRSPGWLWLRNEILDEYASRLGPTGIATYVALCRYAGNRSQECWPSMATLAEAIGVSSRTTVAKALERIEEAGLIRIEARYSDDGSQTSNLYTLLAVEDVGEEPEKEPEPKTKPEPKSDKEKHQAMFSAMARVCKLDWRVATQKQNGILNRDAKVLRGAGATPEQIARFGTWWYNHDWRGQKGEPPKVWQIRDEWGRFEKRKRHGVKVTEYTNPITGQRERLNGSSNS